ncbi:MAG: GNAT family N-acetyltransferase [Anaerovoracaceae bacterium]
MIIRDAEKKDFEAILELNESLVHFLSPMDMKELLHFDDIAAMHKVVEVEGEVVAFLIVIREGKDYSSENYKYFCRNYPEFLYVDRVVVSEKAQGLQLGTKLYEEIIKFSEDTGVKIITAEIYSVPPNEVSLNFHKKFGFKEVGTQPGPDGKKIVSLQVREK